MRAAPLPVPGTGVRNSSLRGFRFSRPGPDRRVRAVYGSIVLGLLAPGCGPKATGGTFDPPRILEAPPDGLGLGASAAERFGFVAMPRDDGSVVRGSLAWDLPEGWGLRASTNFRKPNFDVPVPDGVDGTIDCYVTELPGNAGGLLANVNRWLDQLGAPPVQESQLVGAPRVDFLGESAVLMEELEGEGPGLIGVLLVRPAGSVFLKMVGPREGLREERGSFLDLVASLRRESAPVPGDPSAAGGSKPESPLSSGEGGLELEWEVPPEWTEGEERPFRLVSFRVGESSECYVTVLPGDGGGVGANLDRWRSQMGVQTTGGVGSASQDPARARDVSEFELLGETAWLAEIHGSYRGMSGETQEGATMLVAFGSNGRRTVFVKMIGPGAEVAREQGSFRDFCASLTVPDGGGR